MPSRPPWNKSGFLPEEHKDISYERCRPIWAGIFFSKYISAKEKGRGQSSYTCQQMREIRIFSIPQAPYLIPLAK